jgi:DNA-binding IclR family transcriptional regulator
LQVVSALPNAGQEFTVQEVVAASQANVMRKPFTSSHVSQMLSTLAEAGLVYKNRHGKYSLAVPLLGQFIQRQTSSDVLPKPVG